MKRTIFVLALATNVVVGCSENDPSPVSAQDTVTGTTSVPDSAETTEVSVESSTVTTSPATSSPPQVQTTAAASLETALGDDAASAAAEAWTLVFDSSIGFDAKAAHVEDADALRATIEAYTASGAAIGGITLLPTDVTVSGDTAEVTYDVKFGGTTAYSGLTGQLELVNGTWVVSRAEFCSFMASARNPCPA